MPLSDLDQAIRLEQSVWDAVAAQDGSTLARLLADDYLEVTLEGERIAKRAIVELSPQVDRIRQYKMDLERVLRVGVDRLLLSYRVALDGQVGGQDIGPRERWAMSLWSRTDGVWQCRYFQQSVFASDEV